MDLVNMFRCKLICLVIWSSQHMLRMSMLVALLKVNTAVGTELTSGRYC